MTDEELMYSEVYSFLNLIGIEYINKLPQKLFEFIKMQSKKDIEFDIKQDISSQLSQDSIALIAYFNLQYWVDSEEKARLIELYNKNDLYDEQQKREKYNPDNLFKNRTTCVSNKSVLSEETALIEVKEKNFLQKIFDKIKKFLLKK